MQRLVCEELSPLDAQVVEARAQDPDFDFEVSEWMKLTAKLDSAGDQVFAEIEELRARATEADLDKMREAFQSKPNHGPRTKAWMAPLAAAFLVCLLGGLWWSSQKDAGGNRSGLLGGSQIVEGASPQGSGVSFQRFEIPIEVEGYQVEVEVLDPATHETLATSGRVSSSTWTPEESQYSSWPDSIEWRWVAYRSSGEFDKGKSSPRNVVASR